MDIHTFGKRILDIAPDLTPIQLSKIATVTVTYKYSKLNKGKPPKRKTDYETNRVVIRNESTENLILVQMDSSDPNLPSTLTLQPYEEFVQILNDAYDSVTLKSVKP